MLDIHDHFCLICYGNLKMLSKAVLKSDMIIFNKKILHMEIIISPLTGTKDTDIHICCYLDYISILHLLETCTDFNALLRKDDFWLRYIAHGFKNKKSLDLVKLYHIPTESHYQSFKFYQSITCIRDCIKKDRIDAIVLLELDEVFPTMYDTQIACELGKVSVLEYFRCEHGLLPTNIDLAKKPEEIMRPKKPKTIIMYSELWGPQGVPGPQGVLTAIPYGIKKAIINNHLSVLIWMYNNKIALTQNMVTYTYQLECRSILNWFNTMNNKDNLGLVV